MNGNTILAPSPCVSPAAAETNHPFSTKKEHFFEEKPQMTLVKKKPLARISQFSLCFSCEKVITILLFFCGGCQILEAKSHKSISSCFLSTKKEEIVVGKAGTLFFSCCCWASFSLPKLLYPKLFLIWLWFIAFWWHFLKKSVHEKRVKKWNPLCNALWSP